MSSIYDNPYTALKTIFHEPNRLAIMSALCSSADGLTFKELKESCELTDGNLSRHLKALEEAQVILIEKKFIGAKPRTTVVLTDIGRESFVDYLKALEEVLKKAAEAVAAGGEEGISLPLAWIKPANA
ncbi:MAG: transcriptional regulator [Calditrichaceae bacterium]|nr:transcriptional regulator [Calditrichia bacterium]NUQ40560.1 transcriptional regulator [Calditrichaceae bacterium]